MGTGSVEDPFKNLSTSAILCQIFESDEDGFDLSRKVNKGSSRRRRAGNIDIATQHYTTPRKNWSRLPSLNKNVTYTHDSYFSRKKTDSREMVSDGISLSRSLSSDESMDENMQFTSNMRHSPIIFRETPRTIIPIHHRFDKKQYFFISPISITMRTCSERSARERRHSVLGSFAVFSIICSFTICLSIVIGFKLYNIILLPAERSKPVIFMSPNPRATIFDAINDSSLHHRSIGGLHVNTFINDDNEITLGQFKRTRGTRNIDSNFYPLSDRLGSHPVHKSFYPRTIGFSNDKQTHHRPPQRRIDASPSEFSDNTQLYGVRASDDPALARMERRETYDTDDCVPMKKWQTAYYAVCNSIHELDLVNSHTKNGEEKVELLSSKGYWRYAWKLDLLSRLGKTKGKETVVLKMLKYVHNFEDAHFEHDRIDAIAMERLTSSPHVINIYSFCGHSVITEFADGPRLGTLADKSKHLPLKRLQIARDIASGLADIHGIDGDGNATFVHFDVNPANVVVIGKSLKFNDFNIGILLKWNTTSNKKCGFRAKYPNPQWRSPEEANNSAQLTEKVDVFSLGHIFFRLICGHEPWNKLEVGGRPSAEVVSQKVKAGILPHIPHEVMQSKDRELVAIKNAMLRCYTMNPNMRPSAREIANFLDEELQILSRIK